MCIYTYIYSYIYIYTHIHFSTNTLGCNWIQQFQRNPRGDLWWFLKLTSAFAFQKFGFCFFCFLLFPQSHLNKQIRAKRSQAKRFGWALGGDLVLFPCRKGEVSDGFTLSPRPQWLPRGSSLHWRQIAAEQSVSEKNAIGCHWIWCLPDRLVHMQDARGSQIKQ